MPSLTQEQITQARETDLLDYLLSHESGVLKREGANYRHREPVSYTHLDVYKRQIQDFVVLLQISKSALSPYADRAFIFGG